MNVAIEGDLTLGARIKWAGKKMLEKKKGLRGNYNESKLLSNRSKCYTNISQLQKVKYAPALCERFTWVIM